MQKRVRGQERFRHVTSAEALESFPRFKRPKSESSTTMAAVHRPPNAPIVYSFKSGDEIISNLASFVVHAQKEAIDKKGRFTIALSGGSLPKQLAGLINNPSIKWDKWCVIS